MAARRSGVVALAAIDAEILNLARDRVAADAQRQCRFDSAATGMCQRAGDENALEGLHQLLMRRAATCDETPIHLRSERAFPVTGDGGRHAFAQFGRQVGDLDGLPWRHHRQPVTRVFELADVALKIQRHRVPERRVGKAFGLDAEILRTLGKKVPRQQQDVLAPFAQRRQADADDVEAVEEILAEQAVPDPRFEVLMRRGDDAHIGLDRRNDRRRDRNDRRRARAAGGLQLGRHVPDFVQEQGAALGLLEAAAPLRRCCAGEGAALVAEELGFEQIFRNRRRVDGDKGFIGARAVAVQRAPPVPCRCRIRR